MQKRPTVYRLILSSTDNAVLCPHSFFRIEDYHSFPDGLVEVMLPVCVQPKCDCSCFLSHSACSYIRKVCRVNSLLLLLKTILTCRSRHSSVVKSLFVLYNYFFPSAVEQQTGSDSVRCAGLLHWINVVTQRFISVQLMYLLIHPPIPNFVNHCQRLLVSLFGTSQSEIFQILSSSSMIPQPNHHDHHHHNVPPPA